MRGTRVVLFALFIPRGHRRGKICCHGKGCSAVCAKCTRKCLDDVIFPTANQVTVILMSEIMCEIDSFTSICNFKWYYILVARSSCGRCAQHLRRRESGACHANSRTMCVMLPACHANVAHTCRAAWGVSLHVVEEYGSRCEQRIMSPGNECPIVPWRIMVHRYRNRR
jgi:hypothetical protein